MRIEDKKITQLRLANGLSKTAFAAIIFADFVKVSKVEKGESSYSDDHITLALKHFDAEGMPLSEFDCATVKNRLYIMRDNTRDRLLENAREICNELAKLVNLEPCDDDLPMLYRLFEVILLFFENNIDAAEEKLNYISNNKDKLKTIEHRYYFYYNMGTLYIFRGRYEEGLAKFNEALKLAGDNNGFSPDDIERLHYNIANCYAYLDYPYRSIAYLRNTRELHNGRKGERFGVNLDILFADNYIHVNELELAEKLLQNCLVRAKSINDDHLFGLVMYRYGELHMKKEDWKAAIDCLNKAVEHLQYGSEQHFFALYRKADAIISGEKFAVARRLINEIKNLYHEQELYSVYIKALEHKVQVSKRLTMETAKAEAYILDIAIPYFKSKYDYLEALEYYKLLEQKYALPRVNQKKLLEVIGAICEIYKRCFLYQ